MPEREIPKDIRRFKKKPLFNMTVPQFIGLSVGIVLGLIVYLALPKSVDITTKVVITIAIVVLPMLLCRAEMYGQPLVRFLPQLVEDNFLTPRMRFPETNIPKLPSHEPKTVASSKHIKER